MGVYALAQQMLREAEAKRKILAEVVPEIIGMDIQIIGEWGLGTEEPDAHLPLLKIMAAVYSARPGYRPEWVLAPTKAGSGED